MPYPKLQSKIIKSRKRVARGCGSGTGGTSGRGNKGQNSRSGKKHRAFFEGGNIPLFRRLPKAGGFNRYWAKKPDAVNIQDLLVFEEKDIVNLTSLKERKLISTRALSFKILSKGELDKKLTIATDLFSAQAKVKLEKAGCKFITPELPKTKAEEVVEKEIKTKE